MRINSITSYNYTSNLNKRTKPCKNNEPPVINEPIREPMRQSLSFGTYGSIEAQSRTNKIGSPFYPGIEGDPLAVSPLVHVYIDSDDKLKAEWNKELIEKRGADEYLKETSTYKVFNEGHPDNITTFEDVDAIGSAVGFAHVRFGDVHHDVLEAASKYKYAPVIYKEEKFVKLKKVDPDGFTLHFEFVRDPFDANRELSKRKGFLGALERFGQQGEIQEAKMKNAEAYDLINKFEEKYGLKRGWEQAPMDCRTEDGMKRFKLISLLSCQLYKKLGCIPPPPPTEEELEAQRGEAEKWQKEYANFQRFGDWF